MMAKAPRILWESFPRARAFDLYRIANAFLLIVVGAVYANALGASFQFDDFNVIVDYSAVHSLRAWFDALPSIRPLLKLTYALNWTIDHHPFGFHLFNVICHLVSALLVFCLSRRLIAKTPHIDVLALFAALLFALHPAQTEVVTYISGRSVALMSVFYLGASLAVIDTDARARDWLAPLLFIAAMLSKETAWTLPFAALLLYRVRGASLRESLRLTRSLWIALLAASAVIAATPAYRRMLVHIFSIRSPFENIALQADGWWYLLTRPLLLQTNIDPDLPMAPAFDAWWWLRAAVLALAIVLALCTRRRLLQFALLWLFLHLLPTNSLLPRNDIANDRQLYLALIGPALAIAAWLARLHSQYLRIALSVSLLIVCGATTVQRNREYRDEISLWESTTHVSPNKARVWNNLGYAYQLAGRNTDAIAAYEHALFLKSDYERARINWQLLRGTNGQNDP